MMAAMTIMFRVRRRGPIYRALSLLRNSAQHAVSLQQQRIIGPEFIFEAIQFKLDGIGDCAIQIGKSKMTPIRAFRCSLPG